MAVSCGVYHVRDRGACLSGAAEVINNQTHTQNVFVTSSAQHPADDQTHRAQSAPLARLDPTRPRAQATRVPTTVCTADDDRHAMPSASGGWLPWPCLLYSRSKPAVPLPPAADWAAALVARPMTEARARAISRSEVVRLEGASRVLSTVEWLLTEAMYTKSSRNLAAMSLATYLSVRTYASK